MAAEGNNGRIRSLSDLSDDARRFYQMEIEYVEAVLNGELDDMELSPCPEIESVYSLIPVTDGNLEVIKELHDAGLLKSYWIGFRLKAPILEPGYRDYIKSDEWKCRAERAKEDAGQRCQVCNIGRDKAILDAHHRTYERVGRELPGDITVLCRACHESFHEHRRVARQK